MFGLPAGLGALKGAAVSYIKSVQPFEITVSGSSLSGTATITAVDTTRSVIFYGGHTSSATSTGNNATTFRQELTNSTTVTVTRNATTSLTHVIRGTVVEFTSSLVDSVQAGTIVMNAIATNTATITSVDTSRSAVIYTGHTATSSSTGATTWSTLQLTNATTVTATMGSAANSTIIAFAVIQFKASVIQSLQAVVANPSTTATSQTFTLGTTVNTANSLLLWGNARTSAASFPSSAETAQLTDGSTVTLTRTGTGSGGARNFCYTVVEFVPGILASLQRSTTDVNSVVSADTTVTTVNTSKAFLNWNGWSTSATAVTQNEAYVSAKLLNATTIRGQKNTAGTTISTAAWELVQFN